jgi:preprotein translocase subunit YajC
MTGVATSGLLAMATPGGAAAPQAGGAGMLGMVGYMLIFFALFYFLMIRPQMRKEKERKKMIAEMRTGDRVLFCGGMLGTVSNIKEQVLVVKIADNVKVEVARGAVLRVLSAEENVGDVDVTKQG